MERIDGPMGINEPKECMGKHDMDELLTHMKGNIVLADSVFISVKTQSETESEQVKGETSPKLEREKAN